MHVIYTIYQDLEIQIIQTESNGCIFMGLKLIYHLLNSLSSRNLLTWIPETHNDTVLICFSLTNITHL